MNDRASLYSSLYKVLGKSRQSHHGGNGTWQKGRWRSVKGAVIPCQNGIHYCKPEHLIQWLGPTIWLFEDGTPDETIGAGDKMVTRKGRIVEQVTTWNETTARLFAADCAETALRFIPCDHQEPFVAAINAARGFARGEIGDKERAAAWDAARDAVWAAAWDAARDAVWDAVWDAAWAAVWAAAGDAAWAAAGAAAGDAAGAAAGDAAWAAAGAAAGDAAWAAAWAAARRSQTALLFEYLSGERS